MGTTACSVLMCLTEDVEAYLYIKYRRAVLSNKLSYNILDELRSSPEQQSQDD